LYSVSLIKAQKVVDEAERERRRNEVRCDRGRKGTTRDKKK
jgi:hypothetical protein